MITTSNYSTHPPIQNQPDKTCETMGMMVGLHCLDAVTDTSQQNCPLGARVFYNCCKTSVCICTAYQLSGEVMDTCGINKQEEPFIKNCLAIGFDFGLLHLAQRVQARFRIKEKTN